MQILALVPGGIGDQVLFFPTLAQLKQAYPNAEIDVVVEPRARVAYRICKPVRDTIPFDFKDRSSPADWGNLIGTIRDREYDAVLSLGQRWAVGLLLWLTGIPVRVGFAGSGKFFLTQSVSLQKEQYAADMYHDLVSGFGIHGDRPGLSAQVPQGDLEWAEAEQKELGVKDTGYVLLHGGSSTLAKVKGIDKIYPVKSWQTVIATLSDRKPDLPIVLVEGPEDGEFVESIRTVCPDIKTTKPGNIGQLAAMAAAANLMLCTDSGPMHVSVAVGTYTIALFGPTDPAKLLPPSDKFIGLKSSSGKMGDIEPKVILEKLGV
ncbi:MAG: glycosyltransferase family 9 protein [Cyanobacteria bacterium P01_D01_bin.73]